MLRTFTQEELDELSLRFRGIYESNQKIEELKENIKNYNSSIKDAFEGLAEKLEVDAPDIKKAYKDYIMSIEDPETTETINDIVALLQVNNLLKKEKEEANG